MCCGRQPRWPRRWRRGWPRFGFLEALTTLPTRRGGLKGSGFCAVRRNVCRRPGSIWGIVPERSGRIEHGGKTVFMSTTNGTRALIAAAGAGAVLTGALVNASAVARQLQKFGMDVTLLCAGTGGEFALEDVVGAGAVLDALGAVAKVECASDRARMAGEFFRSARCNLREVLADSIGGRNVLAVGLGADIDFASRLDAVGVVGVVRSGPLRVTR